ncbi:MAG TPA: hypothetical protein VKM36_01690 [Balneolaceae bacterium]|nr:hypothetical protein [Balneolaceae bacterium]
MMIHKESEQSRIQERINILKNKGYLGFSVVNTKRKWDGCEVTARDDTGKVITSEGESVEEAYKALIDRIDQIKG